MNRYAYAMAAGPANDGSTLTTGTERVTRRAHDAIRDGDELLHVFGRHAPLALVIFVFVRRLEIRLQARVLVPERIHVDDHVLHGFEVRHRIDLDRIVGAHDLANRGLASETGHAVDVHRARAADRGPTRAPERDRTVDFGFRIFEASSTVDVSGKSMSTRSRRGSSSTAGSKRKRSSVIFDMRSVRSHFGLVFGEGDLCANSPAWDLRPCSASSECTSHFSSSRSG